MADTNLSFSVGGITVSNSSDNRFIGSAVLIGSFEANLTQEIIATMGGAAKIASAGRLGRASGEFKMNLREIPIWLEELSRGVTANETADTLTTVVQTKKNIVGNSSAHISLGVPAAAADRRQITGVAYFTATATNMVDIRIVSNMGEFHYPNEAVGTINTVRAIGNTGLTWTPASATLTTGNVVEIQFRTGYAAGEQINVAATDSNRRYVNIRIVTASGGADDAVWEYEFKKVLLSGFTDKATDNTSNTDEGVEITGQILALKNSSEPFFAKHRHAV